MKKRLATGYTFDASAQTILHADFSDITLEGILLITNVTDNVIIYNFADPLKGGTLSTDTLTLTFNTTTMDDSDKLMILVEDGITLTKLEDSASASGDAGIPMLAVRQLVDTTTTDADGDYTLLKLDEEGRLKTSSKTASFAACSGVLTTTAASASSTVGDVATAAGYLSVNVSRASNVVLHVKNTGGTNQTAGNFTFEASIDSTTGTDGTWFAIQVVRSNANTIELTTGTLTLNAGVGLGYSYEASVNAYNWFRVRVNVNVTTGAADTWTIIRGSYATEPIPAIQTTGTQAVSIAAAAASIGKAEDAAHANGDVGVPALAVRRDTASSLAGADNDYMPITTDNVGRVWTDPQGNVAHDTADVGNPIKVGGRASTTPVTAVAANDRVDSFFDVQGRQIVAPKAQTATLSNVSSSASNVTLLAANTARLGATIWNDSTAILYVKFGATASATSCTVKMVADSYYEVPFGYYGIIDGIWASANGAARITEIT